MEGGGVGGSAGGCGVGGGCREADSGAWVDEVIPSAVALNSVLFGLQRFFCLLR